MSYRDGETELDLVSSGRGLQQTLLLLAHLYTHPKSVLLFDEPDAHLEILRQREIYLKLREPLKSAELEESVAGIFLQGHEIGAFSYVRQVV